MVTIKRKLVAIFAMVVMLGSVVTTLEITATAQALTVPNISGTWTGSQDTTRIERYTTTFTATQNGKDVEGIYKLTIIWTTIRENKVGQTGSYEFKGKINDEGNFEFKGPKTADSPAAFSAEMSGIWPLSKDHNMLTCLGYNYGGQLIRGTVKRTLTIGTATTTPTTNVAFTLSCTLKAGTTAFKYQPVHLERRSYSSGASGALANVAGTYTYTEGSSGAWGAWANVAGTYKYTNAYGKITLSQTVAVAGTYQYRWHYTGIATYSAAVTVTVKKPTAFAISTSPTTPKFNKPFTISGTLKSGTFRLVGYSVHLERKIGSGSWATVAGTTKKTSTGGLVSVAQRMTAHHTYSYRWRFAGTGTYKACYSPVKTFTV